MVFQTFALFPWLTVLGNVQAGLDAIGVAAGEARTRSLAAIDLIGLDGFESAYPRELSGGMRQRVGFACALVVNPTILLMDEPFSALDVLTSETLRSDFIDLWTANRLPIKSVLLVTYNIEEAVFLCDRILILSSNPGRIAAELMVELPRPRNRDAPAFRAVLDGIYTRMTAGPAPEIAGVPPVQMARLCTKLPLLSAIRITGVAGLLMEPPFNGAADLPVLNAHLGKELNDLLRLADADARLRGTVRGGDSPPVFKVILGSSSWVMPPKEAPDLTQRGAVLAAVKDAARRAKGAVAKWPSLTAAAPGTLRVSGRDEETASFSRTKKRDRITAACPSAGR